MKAFLASSSGRLLFVAFAVAITGTGIAKLTDPAYAIVGPVGVILAFAITIVALATAIQDHPGPAALTVLCLPWLAFLGQIGQALMPASGGYVLVVAGLAAAAVALRPAPSTADSRAELTQLHGI